MDHGRPLLPRDDRQEADAGGGAAHADPRRPADLERPRRDLGAGRQGRGLGRRAADAGPGADQQGDGRLSDPHRLQPRRQRLRGHGLPARPVQGHGPERPHRPGHGLDLKAMATEFAKATGGRRRRRRSSAPSSGRCRASTTRSSRASRSTTIRANASSPSTWRGPGATTCSTPSTANSCRRSTTGREPLRVLRQRRRGDRGAAARRCSGPTTRPGG